MACSSSRRLLPSPAWHAWLLECTRLSSVRLSHSSSRSEKTQPRLMVVPAETVKAATSAHLSIIRLPQDMQLTIDSVATEYGLTGKRARERVLQLLQDLKRLSATQSRGGVVSSADLRAEVQPKRQARAQVLQRIADKVDFEGSAAVSEDEYRLYLGLHPDPAAGFAAASGERRAVVAGVEYSRQVAHAYAMSRMPATYATVLRVLREVEARLPGLQPRSLLDFGSGPGTAVWAAQEVWGGDLRNVVAVEAAAHMAGVGRMLERARGLAGAHRQQVTWLEQLPDLQAGGRSRRRFDVVVASYVLTELPSVQERTRVVRQLWDRTGEVLVLVEPGTPVGAAYVREARALLLDAEARRAAKAGALPASPASRPSPHATRRAGAHVVAPCPHDGACPMQGTEAWCHFSQRVEQPAVMRRLAGLFPSLSSRSHHDEKFSYVVLRRGARQEPAVQVEATREFRHGAAAEGEVAGHIPEAVITRQLELNRQAVAAARGGAAGAGDPAGLAGPAGRGEAGGKPQLQLAAGARLEELDEASLHALLHLIDALDDPPAAGPGTPGAASSSSDADLGSMAGGPASSSSSSTDTAGSSTSAHDDTGRHEGRAAGAVGASAGGGLAAGGAMQGGLVERLMALEDRGLDWAAGSDHLQLAALPPLPSGSSGMQQQAGAEGQAGGTRAAAAAEELPLDREGVRRQLERMIFGRHAGDAGTPSSTSASGEGSHSSRAEAGDADTTSTASASGEGAGGRERGAHSSGAEVGVAGPGSEAQEAAAVAAASSRWSRVVRAPRQRGGHVVLDMCAAVRQPGAAGGGAVERGAIIRQVVAKSERRRWLGSAAYEMAKDARWGDLWPDFYSQDVEPGAASPAAAAEDKG